MSKSKKPSTYRRRDSKDAKPKQDIAQSKRSYRRRDMRAEH